MDVKGKAAYFCELQECGKVFERRSDFLKHQTNHTHYSSQNDDIVPDGLWTQDNVQRLLVLVGNNRFLQPEIIIRQLEQYMYVMHQRLLENSSNLMAAGISYEDMETCLDMANGNNISFNDKEIELLDRLIKKTALENRYLTEKLNQKMAFSSNQKFMY